MLSASISSLCLRACLAMGFLHSVTAATMENRLLRGVCGPYNDYVQSMSTGNGMIQSLQLRIGGTGTYLDDLMVKLATTDVSQRGAYAYTYVSVFNDSMYAGYGTYCTDEDGITTRDGLPIRIASDRDGILVQRKLGGYGLVPEPYALYADGQRQHGVYLGLGNRTAWAFKPEKTTSGIALWTPRLLIEGGLQQGEVQGYLFAD